MKMARKVSVSIVRDWTLNKPSPATVSSTAASDGTELNSSAALGIVNICSHCLILGVRNKCATRQTGSNLASGSTHWRQPCGKRTPIEKAMLWPFAIEEIVRHLGNPWLIPTKPVLRCVHTPFLFFFVAQNFFACHGAGKRSQADDK